MNDLQTLLVYVFRFFSIPFEVYGFEISFMQVLLFGGFAGVVFWVIHEVFLGE